MKTKNTNQSNNSHYVNNTSHRPDKPDNKTIGLWRWLYRNWTQAWRLDVTNYSNNVSKEIPIDREAKKALSITHIFYSIGSLMY